MAKDSPKPKGEAETTPFERFERLTKRLVAVPKDEARERKGRKPAKRSS